MKILSAEQIRALDRYTIEHEAISSIDLMERAAKKVFEAISKLVKLSDVIHVFCGMGNNGGDGLAVARMLIETGYRHVTTYIVRHAPEVSSDFTINESRLKYISGVQFIETVQQLPKIEKESIVIDAIFGTGLSRSIKGIAGEVIKIVNHSGAKVYSIDVPSGLYCDKPNGKNDPVIQSDITFTFHSPKLSFLFASGGKYASKFKVLDIGLNRQYAESLSSCYYYITPSFVKSFFKERGKFSHKGTYGHALIAAGSYGKTGAAVLAVRAALKSGAGLVSANIPRCSYEIIQSTCPEAMVITDTNENILTAVPELEKFSAIGVGPGIGTEKPTRIYLQNLLADAHSSLVLDADALNIISNHADLLLHLPPKSILTPHPGEFKRLAGDWVSDWERLEKQIDFSKRHEVVTVLKGAHTSIATPGGKVYFNSTGNPGMAKGGSGDVLTGIITALLAQKYSSEEAAILGVYVHGLAGDLAAEHYGETGMTSGDEIVALHAAFKTLE